MDIEKIIAEMTVEEKASLCSGLNFWETKPVERVGVPSVMMTDGPHGLRKQDEAADHLGIAKSVPATCFPAACATACSFDRSLLTEMGAAIGHECNAANVRIILGPGVNIKRSPLCGRNFEYFSEDPLLGTEMAAAYINGVQSKGVGTSIKHFAVNNREARRFSSDSIVDERTLFEIYLASFEGAIKKAQPATVMCSYNRLNGEYCSENHYLLTEILRDKWGFRGLVVSDWGAVNERVKGLMAGLELEMPATDGVRDKHIADAVKSGELSMETLDTAVRRILSVFERVTDERGAVSFDANKHHALARKIAAESMVLLTNNGTLPLKKGGNVLFVGEFAEKPRYQGAGSSQVNPTALDSPLEAARQYAEIKYAKGFEIESGDKLDEALATEAVNAAKSVDVCVVFVGLPPSYESEGFDREHMRLPAVQNELIEKLSDVCENVVVVLQNGSPVEMPWVNDVSAILEAYLGGQASGGAIADLLFGAANPCGRLAETFPLKLADNPSYLSFGGEGDRAEYPEGVFVGYRYYETKEMPVLFPFGHGLSYTSFEYANLTLSASEISDTDTLTATVDVTNTGSVAGKEVIQLYVAKKDKDDIVARPVRELRAFEKVELKPGETKTVTFTLDKRAFSYYNTQIHDFHVLSGTYIVQIGRSSRDIALEKEVSVKSTVKIPAALTVNTPFKDILRMEGGKELLEALMSAAPDMPGAPSADAEAPEPGSLGMMFQRMFPEMVPRSMTMHRTELINELEGIIRELNGKSEDA